MVKIQKNFCVAALTVLLLAGLYSPQALAQSTNAPSDRSWRLIAADGQEGCAGCIGADLKAIYGKVENGIIYFKIRTYKKWTSQENVDFRIFLDPDQYEWSGDRANFYRLPEPGMGADGVIIVGNEDYPRRNIVTEFWRYDDVFMSWNYGFDLAYLNFPETGNEMIVGIYYDDMARQVPRSVMGPVKCNINLAVTDTISEWDWIPDKHHLNFPIGPCPDAASF